MELYRRAKNVLSGEGAMITLEAAIVCAFACILTAYVLRLLFTVMDFGTTRNGWTSSTGWFRNTDTDGIMIVD